MHAIEVANLLGVTTVVVPPHPGIASAYGLLVAEFKNDYARTSLQQPPDYDLQGMAEIFAMVWSGKDSSGWKRKESPTPTGCWSGRPICATSTRVRN